MVMPSERHHLTSQWSTSTTLLLLTSQLYTSTHCLVDMARGYAIRAASPDLPVVYIHHLTATTPRPVVQADDVALRHPHLRAYTHK
jgi:hypothetical protein